MATNLNSRVTGYRVSLEKGQVSSGANIYPIKGFYFSVRLSWCHCSSFFHHLPAAVLADAPAQVVDGRAQAAGGAQAVLGGLQRVEYKKFTG